MPVKHRLTPSVKWLWLWLALVVIGCEGQATPLPAVIPPTTTPPIAPTTPPTLRYALVANTLGYVDRSPLAANALVDQLSDVVTDERLLEGYDIVAGFGVQDGWERAPVALQAVLLINPNLAPLNDPAIVDILSRAIDTDAVVFDFAIPGTTPARLQSAPAPQLRTELANLGYPDGFALTLAYAPSPGLDTLIAQLNAANFDIQAAQVNETITALNANQAHLGVVLVPGIAPDDLLILDLYTLPIGYRILSDDVGVTFAPNGFPIPRRIAN